MDDAKVNMYFAVHGEQKITLHGPIPTSGTFYSTAVLKSVYDKGDNGAVLNFEVSGTDEKGRPLFDNKFVCVDRSAGNFGGDRGPKFERLDPPEGREPDFKVAYATAPDQGALYRLSGDFNPLHIEPEFAAKGGFDRPILHGLCTYGFTGRAILHTVCGSDPCRLKSFSARFMGVVFPGDTLTIQGWKVDDGRYIVQTTTQDGRVVLGSSLAEIA
jgi:acyl dehydratase